MANVAPTRESRAPGARIAGPRRVRVTPPPLPASVAAAPVVEPQVVAPPHQVAAPLELPSLDYDEPTTRRPSLNATQATRLVGDRRRPSAHDATVAEPRSRSGRWFAMGLVAGILAVTFARGDAMNGMRSARLWSASTLRALKKSQEPARVQNVPGGIVASMQPEAPPCSLTDEDCAILMAPFVQAEAQAAVAAQDIPVIDVNALPKWKPPVVYVAPPPKPVEIASPVAQPDTPSAAGGAPVDEPAPKPSKRAPGPFDAPPPVDGPGAMASAPMTP